MPSGTSASEDPRRAMLYFHHKSVHCSTGAEYASLALDDDGTNEVKD